MNALDRELGDPRRYAEAIERMAEHPERYGDERLSIVRLRERQAELGPRLARAVAAGEYRLGPVRERLARIDGKERRLCLASLLDTIVLFALARLLVEAVEPRLSPRVFSYRRGRSNQALLAELGAFVRQHRRALPQPRQRGLYVVRADVAAYGESIRVDDGSPLWPELRALVRDRGGQRLYDLLKQAIRPLVHALDGSVGRRERGVPTGSPVQPALCNLYLTPLDEALASVPGAFYGRFGDDLLFAHAEAAVARSALATSTSLLGRLGLRAGEEKQATLFFSAAGRPSPSWPEATPTQHVAWLGSRVDFHGRVGLHARKYRELVLRLRARLRLADELLAAEPRDVRLRALCDVAVSALDPASMLADRRAPALVTIDDATQLHELDYLVALTVAEQLSGRRGPRAFRDVSYRELRRAGLWSAEHRRNLERRP